MAEISVEAPAHAPAEDAIGRVEPTKTARPTARPTRKTRVEPTAAPAPEMARAPARQSAGDGVGGEVAGGVAGGTVGGEVGGAIGGKIGGTLGATGDLAVRAELVAQSPTVLSQVRPKYPAIARARSQEGQVLLELVIGHDGRVEPASVQVKQSAASFDAPAIEAVKQWRFTPGRDAGGRTVRVLLEVPIRFQLK